MAEPGKGPMAMGRSGKDRRCGAASVGAAADAGGEEAGSSGAGSMREFGPDVSEEVVQMPGTRGNIWKYGILTRI